MIRSNWLYKKILAPPSPLMAPITHLAATREIPDHNHIGLHTLSRNMPRPSQNSPPLPPPPEENADFGRPRQSIQPIVPEDQNLPGWVINFIFFYLI
jgi:hypothetical protein